MILSNIKSSQKDRGFTIVELLVVIVVIGILAAITIVSYTGITARANTAKSQSNANSIGSVADAYAVDPANSGYPTLAQLNAYSGYTSKPASITVIAGSAAILPGTGTFATTNVLYLNKGTTGACVGYWDTQANAMAYDLVGNAVTGNLNIASPTCV